MHLEFWLRFVHTMLLPWCPEALATSQELEPALQIFINNRGRANTALEITLSLFSTKQTYRGRRKWNTVTGQWFRVTGWWRRRVRQRGPDKSEIVKVSGTMLLSHLGKVPTTAPPSESPDATSPTRGGTSIQLFNFECKGLKLAITSDGPEFKIFKSFKGTTKY